MTPDEWALDRVAAAIAKSGKTFATTDRPNRCVECGSDRCFQQKCQDYSKGTVRVAGPETCSSRAHHPQTLKDAAADDDA